MNLSTISKLGILTLLMNLIFVVYGFGQKPSKKDSLVLLNTPYGEMVLVLYPETPKHRSNFLKLVQEGFYQDLLFHRVIKDFMIQGGDPDSRNAPPQKQLGAGGPAYTVDAEFDPKLFHKKGALAAARKGDQVNPEKASSGSQFYIVQGKVQTEEDLIRSFQRNKVSYTSEQKETYQKIGGTPFLDQGYTVFGEVIHGLEIIDKIAEQKTKRGDRPEQDIQMDMQLKVMKKKKVTKNYGYTYE